VTRQTRIQYGVTALMQIFCQEFHFPRVGSQAVQEQAGI
jgi:hypothetical protein